ncbi:hypothetical protein QQF64_009142 [Cirrhinus molitorella]|uniref:Uncharacterized protein n=1 Tax=Cirrhinus molitorella TaxID=172907 RepID=A0ABR3M1W9_9TELE
MPGSGKESLKIETHQFKQNLRSLGKILRTSWEDRCINISILEEANLSSIITTIMQYQLRWISHVIRMPNTRLPKQILYSQLREGSQAIGGQKKHYKDNIKINHSPSFTTDSHLDKEVKDSLLYDTLVLINLGACDHRKITEEEKGRVKEKLQQNCSRGQD